MSSEEEAKKYIDDMVRNSCAPMLDEMRATDELLPHFPGNEPEVDWNDADNVRVINAGFSGILLPDQFGS